MSKLKTLLTKVAYGGEKTIDSLKARLTERLKLNGRANIHPYTGYGTPETLYLRGRVLGNRSFTSVEADDSLLENLLNTYRHIESHEVAHAKLEASIGNHTVHVTADEEGYFQIALPTPPDASGWQEINLTLLETDSREPVTAVGHVMLPAPSASFGIISDIDDTIMISSATNYLRAAQLMFLQNARTRTPFPGVAALYQALQNSGSKTNPIFYVSSSPWNLFDLLTDFFEFQGIPRGPLFLKDYGITADSFISSGHGKHKMAQFDTILTTYPDLPFILIGDSGQKDPEIYQEVIAKYPGRIKAAYIRDVTENERDAEVVAIAQAVESQGIPMILAADSTTVAAHAAGLGLLSAAEVAAVQHAIDKETANTLEAYLS